MTSRDLRILIVDDTALYRSILSHVIDSIPGCSVSDTAPNGKIALEKLQRKLADMVLLDVEMPVMGGLETLVRVKAVYPEMGVVMISSINANSASITVEALENGAVDFVPKPDGLSREEAIETLRSKLHSIVQLFSTLTHARRAQASPDSQRRGHEAGAEAQPIAKPRVVPATSEIDVVAIGISTGGPNALGEMLPEFPTDLGVPVLVVQHMPPLFTKSLANSLASKCAMVVEEGEEGMVIERNKIIIAPGGYHMRVSAKSSNGNCRTISLSDGDPIKNCRPSVDIMFESVAASYDGRCLALVMTGMGDDGCDGVRSIKAKKGFCITQSEESCTVYGMPRSVDVADLSDESVSLSNLAARVTVLVRSTGV